MTCAVVASAAFGRWAATSPDFAIRDLRVTGLSKVSEADFWRLAGIEKGQNLVIADLGEAERRVLQHPWVRAASVSRTLPRGVRADVREWAPAALVDLGHLYMVSGDGEVFRRVEAGDDFDLPVITGIRREDFVERRAEVEPLLREALAAASAYGRRPLAKREPLSEVRVDAVEGVALVLGADAFVARLGSSPFDGQIARLGRLLDELTSGGARAQVLRLDNRSRPDWVAVRLSTGGALATRRQDAALGGSRGPMRE